tara:strand:+ start:9154 stop:10011 length:858 start_codon:yes stop_codon:yes gene_type:complete
MIAFIIAFRHPDSTKNYAHVVTLLEATLHSLVNQKNDNFKVYIGCNNIPELNISDPRIIFCPISCPLPNNRQEVLLDKGVKRAAAIRSANNDSNPDYYFMLDADDLVSKHCVSTLHTLEQSSSGGYWLDRGYLLDMLNRRVQEKCGFNRYCGSSLILNAKLITDVLFLQRGSHESMKIYDDFINGCSLYVLEHVLGNHIVVKDYMTSLNYPLKKLNQPFVCWKINTGENESKTKIPSGSKNMDRKFLEEFSIPIEYERKTHILETIIERYRFISSWVASKWSSYK